MSNTKLFPKMADLERIFNDSNINETSVVNPKSVKNKAKKNTTSVKKDGGIPEYNHNDKGNYKGNYKDTKYKKDRDTTNNGINNSDTKYRSNKQQAKYTGKPKPKPMNFNLADDPSITELEYKSVKSRQQFESLWKVPTAKDALVYILSKTLRDTINNTGIINIIERYNGKPNADELIYKALNAEYNKKQHNTDTSSITKYRIDARVRDLAGILTDDMKSPKTYLDFGGGDGTISEGIAQWLGVKKENAISADVESWLSGTQAQKQLKHITFNTIPKAGQLPYKDGQFNAITCFVVLHHIEQLDDRIDELYRILAPGGWLLIREHDCRDNATRAIIDIYHNLFELVYNKAPNYKQVLDEYYGEYKAKEQWHFTMRNAGFENMTNLKYPDIKPDDLLRVYYYVYTKK